MSPFSLPSLIAFAINVSLVIIVVLDTPKSHAHRLFGLVILFFALWNVADIIVINSSTREIAAIGTIMIVVVFLFASTFFLLLSFSNEKTALHGLSSVAYCHTYFDCLSGSCCVLCNGEIERNDATKGVLQEKSASSIMSGDRIAFNEWIK